MYALYTPASELRQGWQIVGRCLAGFYAGRELAWRIFQRDLKAMYRQTLLGVFWAFLPPLANTLIWVFLHSQRVIDFGSDLGVAYVAFVLTGMVIWQSFVDALLMPLSAFKQNRAMISKLNFHREALLLVGWGDLTLNLAIRVGLLLPVLWFFGVSITGTAGLFPLGIFLLVLLGTGMGLLLLPFAVLYQDVERLLSLGLPLWMIVTPIIYPVALGGNLVWLQSFNPAAALLMTARDSLLGRPLDWLAVAGVHAIIAVPMLLLGLVVFRLAIPVLIERMPN